MKLRITDWPLEKRPSGQWRQHDKGLPEDVPIVVNNDPHVLELFSNVKPNVTTAPLSALTSEAGFNRKAAMWLSTKRQKSRLHNQAGFSGSPDYSADAYEQLLEGVTFQSHLFLATAEVRRQGEAGWTTYWVLQRKKDEVVVLYSGPEKAL